MQSLLLTAPSLNDTNPMQITLPSMTPGDWQEYTMQSSSGRTVYGRFVQVVHDSTVTRIAELSAQADTAPAEQKSNLRGSRPSRGSGYRMVIHRRPAHIEPWLSSQPEPSELRGPKQPEPNSCCPE